jgi:uncharacterized protein YkwD
MKIKNFSKTALAAFFFTAFSFIAHAQSQKPQAILIAEWSEPNETAVAAKAAAPPQTTKTQTVRAAVRARIVQNQNYNSNSVAEAVSIIPNPPTVYRYGGRYAALRPTALEQKAFDLVNEQRRLQNLPPVEWDLEMLFIARQHSENMAQYNFFDHRGLDGKTADQRANDAGAKDWRAIGENIAFNQGIKNSVDFAVQCWMYSLHHKENLLNKKWTRSGVGVAVASDGRFYITQVFRN